MNTTKLLPVLLFSLCWSLVAFSQLKAPMWEMPFYFEDGNGDRDTLFFGIDTAATGQLDTLYEDPNIDYDTINFQVLFAGGRGNTTGKRLVVAPNPNGVPFVIIVRNAYQYIDITYDVQKLADTTNGIKNVVWDEKTQSFIPDIYKGSAIWIRIGSQLTTQLACGFAEQIAIYSGSPDLPQTEPEPVCHVTTSILGISPLGSSGGSKEFHADLISELKPMNKLGSNVVGVGIEKNQVSELVVFPNPLNSVLWLENKSFEPVEIIVFNSLGVIVQRLKLAPFETKQADFTALSSGLYQIEYRSMKGSGYKKVLKL